MKKLISVLLIFSFLLLSSCSETESSNSKKEKNKSDIHDKTEESDSSNLESEGNLGSFFEGLGSLFGDSSDVKEEEEEESSGELSSSDVPDTPNIEKEYTIADFLSSELIDKLNGSISDADVLLEKFNDTPDDKTNIFEKKYILDMLINANCIKLSTIGVVISELNTEYDRVKDSRRDKISEIIDLYTSLQNETTDLYVRLINKYEDISDEISSDPELYSQMVSFGNDFNEKAAALIKEQLSVSKSGQAMWPIITGYISANFGVRMINGEKNFHSGTDIAAAMGTSVFASCSGEVISCGYDEGYGFYVLIYHGVDSNGDSIATLYGHLETLLVEKGMKVSTGDVIGKVGNSGMSLGSHLHFAYFINGDLVDPENYVTH